MMKTAMVTQRVEAVGSRIHSADGVPESDEPTAVLMRRMVDAFAEFELAMIRARTKAALAVKKARGEAVGRTPVGHKRDGKFAVPDQEALVELRATRDYARRLQSEGLSLRAICDRFAAEGVRYRDYDWKFTMHVHRVLNHALPE